MREPQKYFPVNWIDGMKLNKNHFISQDNAWLNRSQEITSLITTPFQYGILPPSSAGENTFNVKLSLDNQAAVKVSVISCHAITQGGAGIAISDLQPTGNPGFESLFNKILPFTAAGSEATWWVFLLINPYDKLPAGSPDLSETPPRLPNVIPNYSIELVGESNYQQFTNHPFGLPIGKIMVNGSDIKVEEDYIPPCFWVLSHPDLISLHGELDQFLSHLESYCSQVVQKIYVKKQQNEISELVLFFCDRVMLYLGQALNQLRWKMLYQSPLELLLSISTLARIMKNAIDLRIGSGKEELMNYLCEWCELKQGELETMLSRLSNMSYRHHDINQNISQIVSFVKVSLRLFETLSKLEFIGKRKESGVFVKEEVPTQTNSQQTQRRRFFG